MTSLSAREIIRLLDLRPHPEGGHYRETFRDSGGPDGRGASSLIYFLLDVGDVSAWHRVDATEVWHYYAGAPLVLTVSPDGHDAHSQHLGPALAAGQRPQLVVPAGHWQTAASLGAWTLVGCTVAPGFRFEGFELRPPIGVRSRARPADQGSVNRIAPILGISRVREQSCPFLPLLPPKAASRFARCSIHSRSSVRWARRSTIGTS